MDQDVANVRKLWEPWAFGIGEHASLGQVVGDVLCQRSQTLSVAESCTGGLLAASLVDISGSSAWFAGGWVTYSNDLKHACLGVPLDMLEQHGAVSAPVAQAMANGAMKAAKSDYAIAITGIAGPDGGSAHKPVGTVFIACVSQNGDARAERVRRFCFTGNRLAVRDRSAKAGLQMLRFGMLGVSDTPMLWQVQLDGQPLDTASQMCFETAGVAMSRESS